LLLDAGLIVVGYSESNYVEGSAQPLSACCPELD
jgi:hypothetical protein